MNINFISVKTVIVLLGFDIFSDGFLNFPSIYYYKFEISF